MWQSILNQFDGYVALMVILYVLAAMGAAMDKSFDRDQYGLDEEQGDECGILPPSYKSPAQIRREALEGFASWAKSRWEAEVEHRPAENIFWDILDKTWKQVIREAERRALAEGGEK